MTKREGITEYLNKCLELSERDRRSIRIFQSLDAQYRSLGIDDKNIALKGAEVPWEYIGIVRDDFEAMWLALPKVCEALKIALHALDELQDYAFYSQADRCEYLDRKFLLINRLFDDADGG